MTFLSSYGLFLRVLYMPASIALSWTGLTAMEPLRAGPDDDEPALPGAGGAPVRARTLTPLVLLVEDDRRMRRYLRDTLADQRLRVVESETGSDGLAQAAAHNPDIVVLDLGLPDIDGLRVTERLREWTAAPILILSAHDEEHDKVAALDAGANDFLDEALRHRRAARRASACGSGRPSARGARFAERGARRGPAPHRTTSGGASPSWTTARSA